MDNNTPDFLEIHTLLDAMHSAIEYETSMVFRGHSHQTKDTGLSFNSGYLFGLRYAKHLLLQVVQAHKDGLL